MAALNEPKLDLRYRKVAQLLDIDRFMSFTAVAVVLNTVDAYPLQANSIRIYSDPATKKFVFFPSGNDRIFHSDRGVQYAAGDFRAALAHAHLVPSMSRRGNCYDNATMESFWSTLKLELMA